MVDPVILFSLTNEDYETYRIFDDLKIKKKKECNFELILLEEYRNVGSINENLYIYQLKCKANL